MKIIITENRLHNLILNYIEDAYPVDDINYTEGYDDEDGEIIFRWYGENYWDGDDTELLRLRIEQSPMLHFEDSRDSEKLDSLFGNNWKPIFKEWFEKYFDLNIKTIL